MDSDIDIEPRRTPSSPDVLTIFHSILQPGSNASVSSSNAKGLSINPDDVHAITIGLLHAFFLLLRHDLPCPQNTDATSSFKVNAFQIRLAYSNFEILRLLLLGESSQFDTVVLRNTN
ncbi:hypothetical protein CVT26_006359 [Gymnopilus dilepis]|uniref:Uncharacterized protein n=1 Tax=Gymnopilus dilepis TaxID=231916 RepID=A0A409W641_9AGAR|nr:hypothetical protein CVT26_006359 [Gymnopilus dilepis]